MTTDEDAFELRFDRLPRTKEEVVGHVIAFCMGFSIAAALAYGLLQLIQFAFPSFYATYVPSLMTIFNMYYTAAQAALILFMVPGLALLYVLYIRRVKKAEQIGPQ